MAADAEVKFKLNVGGFPSDAKCIYNACTQSRFLAKSIYAPVRYSIVFPLQIVIQQGTL